MSLVTTTLASACAQTDKSITVTSATTVAAGRFMLVDQELMQVTKEYTSGVSVNVTRGLDGTAQVAHKTTAAVTHGLGSDFATPGAQALVTYPAIRPTVVTSVTATSSLTLPTPGCDWRVVINATSAITLTIPVPTKDMDGTVLWVVSSTVAAHVPTFTGGLGGVGAGYTALTAGAGAQICIQAIACNGLWNIPSAPGWTGTVTKVTAGIA